MPILELLIVTTVLVLIAVLALSVRIIFTKKGEFRGGSCKAGSDKLNHENIGCGCGAGTCNSVD